MPAYVVVLDSAVVDDGSDPDVEKTEQWARDLFGSECVRAVWWTSDPDPAAPSYGRG